MGRLQSIDLPEYGLNALRELEGAGFQAWFVGGCVRDALIGRKTNDIDIATSASWQSVEHTMAAAGYAVHRTGTKHGTVTVSADGRPLEITTYRSDGAYTDGRHPDSVSFVTTIEEDLARRDFTINALAYHPDRGLLDCWDGISDLERGVIRTVGDPALRFGEDGLRILRGCRFASQLGFSIEDETLQAMKARKMMLLSISAERVTHELDALLLGDYVHDALLEAIDVLGAIMPEIVACKNFDQHSPYHVYDVWEHTAWVVQRAPKTRLARWVALFHDAGKPGACFFEGERAHFYGHAELSAVIARDIMKRLNISPRFIEDAVLLIRLHDVQIPATAKQMRRLLAKLDGNVELARTLIDVKRADALAHSKLGQERVKVADALADALADVLEDDAAFTVKQLAIDGHDVMGLGMPAGPEVGSALELALQAVIDEKVANDHDALLEYLLGQLALPAAHDAPCT